ncbi:MAG: hypothetical protein HN704_04700 [Bacteroidetes bacterium]|jgi:hypothetical protein|nr:hypothetical protein [Bacteroidota bacterium]MBT6686011.1 hypothetical protein [Bacteroidota bacterium]MBT7143793.1 hypothetical protein [Bacteroidota bacterium]MBT7490892.1 hypothetical protein [Bacteroidota bacterium]
MDHSGNFVWAKTFGGSNDDKGNSIAIDVTGNIYITGNFKNTVDFDPRSGISNLISNGGNDIFIMKLDSSGNFVYAKNIGGSYDDSGFSLALDTSANVYITGSFTDITDFDSGIGVFNLTSNGNEDIFITK